MGNSLYIAYIFIFIQYLLYLIQQNYYNMKTNHLKAKLTITFRHEIFSNLNHFKKITENYKKIYVT